VDADPVQAVGVLERPVHSQERPTLGVVEGGGAFDRRLVMGGMQLDGKKDTGQDLPIDPSARSQARDAGHALGSVLGVMPVVGAADVMPGDGVYERFELGGLQADRAGHSVGVDEYPAVCDRPWMVDWCYGRANVDPKTDSATRPHGLGFVSSWQSGDPFQRSRAVADACDMVLPERMESLIVLIRGQRVMLAEDLAALYEVEVRALNQAVVRNAERFPADFMFQLTGDEVADLRSQIVTSRAEDGAAALKSQSVISNSGEDNPSPGRGGRRYLPYAFSEQGVAMLSSVLRSPRAILVNVEITRAFAHFRRMLGSNADLAWKLATLEKKYDGQFKVVFDAIRALMTPPDAKKRRAVGPGPSGQN
jgi:hypothetical protein